MHEIVNLTHHPLAIAALALFVVAYGFVLTEEFTNLNKSKPLLLAAGVVWILVAIAWRTHGHTGVEEILKQVVLEFAELFLFLLVAMSFVNTMDERGIFIRLRVALLARGYGFRQLFWITGTLAFALSPILDNLTTALVMGAVVLTIGRQQQSFVVPACVNIVVAANAGGAFSPFGDITTLMVWQHGTVTFLQFLSLFVPSLVNWLVPALIMTPFLPTAPPVKSNESSGLKKGAWIVVWFFAGTIALTVVGHHYLHLPPFLGMMTGLGALTIFGHGLRQEELAAQDLFVSADRAPSGFKPLKKPFNVFTSIKRIEWDTMLFFYGVILCVGGLGALGYLSVLSSISYAQLGTTWTNILVGLLSAIVDNIPVMYAVLGINPDMGLGQWLLVTLTAGVGGSLLSIGSAGGVALMGQARGIYTFFAHLRWTWAVALGYAASVWMHFLLNAKLFGVAAAGGNLFEP